jgi:hypothetical protein
MLFYDMYVDILLNMYMLLIYYMSAYIIVTQSYTSCRKQRTWHEMPKHEMQINTMHDRYKVIIQRRYYLTYSKFWIITSNYYIFLLKVEIR